MITICSPCYFVLNVVNLMFRPICPCKLPNYLQFETIDSLLHNCVICPNTVHHNFGNPCTLSACAVSAIVSACFFYFFFSQNILCIFSLLDSVELFSVSEICSHIASLDLSFSSMFFKIVASGRFDDRIKKLQRKVFGLCNVFEL